MKRAEVVRAPEIGPFPRAASSQVKSSRTEPCLSSTLPLSRASRVRDRNVDPLQLRVVSAEEAVRPEARGLYVGQRRGHRAVTAARTRRSAPRQPRGGTRIGVDRARWRGERGALRTRQHRYALIWALKHFDIIRPRGATSGLIILSAAVPQQAKRGCSCLTKSGRTRCVFIKVGWSF